MTNIKDSFDWKKFLADCETCCFDCGSSKVDLTKIETGVALCSPCLETAKDDYPTTT